MNFDPQKFFIGLMDFFTILLPGALLTYLGMHRAGPIVLGPHFYELTGAQGWAAFLFASYLLGHLIFLIGAWLDEFYDWARGYTLNAQIRRLADGHRRLNRVGRAMVWLIFKRERDLAVDRVVAMKRRTLGESKDREVMNAFQWSKALLQQESPQSVAVVQRFEADSKFFRCLTVVLLVLIPALPFQQRWPAGWALVVLVALMLLALWRYMEQRHKSVNQAYWSVITLTAKEGGSVFKKHSPPSDGPTHAGGVVFRKHRGKVLYLLVEAKDDPSQLVLPKGHIEAGESERETAVREVHEESGVWARVLGDLPDLSYPLHGDIVHMRCFLMEFAGQGRRTEKERGQKWLEFDAAVEKATHADTMDALRFADEARKEEEARHPRP